MSSQDYRLWIEEARESHLTDRQVLRSFSEESQTPFGVAGPSNRVSTVRIQCHYLNHIGYLNNSSADTYSITADGDAAIKQDDLFDNGYVPIGEEMRLGYEHVTDLGDLLDSDTIIKINKEFFASENVDYEETEDSPHDIERVRDGRLERLTTEFPRFEPLANQLAHIVRTFCGHHLFPDANHRTGTHIADMLAKKQGHDLFSLIQQDRDGIRRAVEISKILRGLCSNIRNSIDYLWMKDELFYHWNRYFRDLLYDLRPNKRVHTDTGICQYENLTSNERVSLIYRFALLETDEMQDALSEYEF